MQSVIPYIKENRGGSIVNCVSLAAIIGGADNGATAFTVAKGGVRALSKHAAINFAEDKIRVNSIYPEAILTGTAKRHGVTSHEVLGKAFEGTATDIANGYLYLASDESRFVTGEELVIDGGWSTK